MIAPPAIADQILALRRALFVHLKTNILKTHEGSIHAWESRQRAVGLVSPSIAEHGTLESVQQAMNGQSYALAKQRAAEVLHEATGDGSVEPAIGAWADGAEESMFMTGEGNDGVDYATAKLGAELNQKAVLTFHPGDGPDSLWRVKVATHDFKAVGDSMEKAGISYRTLLPTANGIDAVVYDQGSKLQPRIETFGGEYHAEIERYRGEGKFIGSDDRTAAQQEYQRVTEPWERVHKGSDGGSGQGAHQLWDRRRAEALAKTHQGAINAWITIHAKQEAKAKAAAEAAGIPYVPKAKSKPKTPKVKPMDAAGAIAALGLPAKPSLPPNDMGPVPKPAPVSPVATAPDAPKPEDVLLPGEKLMEIRDRMVGVNPADPLQMALAKAPITAEQQINDIGSVKQPIILKPFEDAASEWKQGGSNFMSWAISSFRQGGEEALKQWVAGEKFPGQRAAYTDKLPAVMQALEHAPLETYGPTFRSLNGYDMERFGKLKEGDSFQMIGPKGFSHAEHMRTFNGNNLMVIDGPARGINIAGLGSSYETEEEFITAGRFKISKVEDVDVKTVGGWTNHEHQIHVNYLGKKGRMVRIYWVKQLDKTALPPVDPNEPDILHDMDASPFGTVQKTHEGAIRAWDTRGRKPANPAAVTALLAQLPPKHNAERIYYEPPAGDPDFQRIVEAAKSWTRDSDASNNMSWAASALVKYGEGGLPRWKQDFDRNYSDSEMQSMRDVWASRAPDILQGIQLAPEEPRDLYRGLYPKDVVAMRPSFEVGKELQLAGPKSFTYDPVTAIDYGITTKTILHLEGNSRAINTSGISPFAYEQEAITGGRFQVTKIETRKMSDLAPLHHEKDPRDVQIIHLKQLGVFDVGELAKVVDTVKFDPAIPDYSDCLKNPPRTAHKTHEGAIHAWESRQRKSPKTENGLQDISSWKQVGPQAGSNPGGTYQSPAGYHYYVKFPQRNPEQVRSEQLANSIYRAAGVPVPETQLVTGKGGELGLASKFLKDPVHLDRDQMAASMDVKHGFAVDALLANHDVIGLDYDNIVHSQGHDYRIDNGGSMFFRAQGAAKNFPANEVCQLDSMRDPGIAHEAGYVFQSLSDADLAAQATHLSGSLPDSTIKSLVGEAGLPAKYSTTLIGRRNAIAQRFAVQKTHEGALTAWQTRYRNLGITPPDPNAPKPAPLSRHDAALKNFTPQTLDKELIAHESEKRIAEAIGGESTTDANPMDIWWPSVSNAQVGIEVKTLIKENATNVRVNMRPQSRAEKLQALDEKRGIVVLVDQRGRKDLADKDHPETIYWKDGMGAWRLDTMNKVNSIAELKEALKL